jgi:hypothetical protein
MRRTIVLPRVERVYGSTDVPSLKTLAAMASGPQHAKHVPEMLGIPEAEQAYLKYHVVLQRENGTTHVTVNPWTMNHAQKPEGTTSVSQDEVLMEAFEMIKDHLDTDVPRCFTSVKYCSVHQATKPSIRASFEVQTRDDVQNQFMEYKKQLRAAAHS